AQILKLEPTDIVVNVQGDEPELDPTLIDAAIEAFVKSGEEMGTLVSPLQDGDDVQDPSLVKVVIRLGDDGVHRAVYFSRAVVPFDRDRTHYPGNVYLKHAGLYVYRRSLLD